MEENVFEGKKNYLNGEKIQAKSFFPHKLGTVWLNLFHMQWNGRVNKWTDRCNNQKTQNKSVKTVKLIDIKFIDESLLSFHFVYTSVTFSLSFVLLERKNYSVCSFHEVFFFVQHSTANDGGKCQWQLRKFEIDSF